MIEAFVMDMHTAEEKVMKGLCGKTPADVDHGAGADVDVQGGTGMEVAGVQKGLSLEYGVAAVF